MPYLLNLVYLAAWLLLAPWLCWQWCVRKKPMRGLGAKWLGRVKPVADATRPIAWFHGVSLGEIHLLRQVVAQFRKRFPDWQCVISTTTNTGYDEACKCFADLHVIYWPFDFTWAVDAALQTIQPTLVVLSEGEIWPNFVHAAKQRGIKIAVINGRMSPRSAKRFRLFRWLLGGVFTRLDLIGAQNDEYRQHYETLGAVHAVTTGNIKYDGVNVDRRNARTLAMQASLGLTADALVWVAGSTQDPEESLAIDIYRRLTDREGEAPAEPRPNEPSVVLQGSGSAGAAPSRCANAKHPKLRLVLVPRHPERFDEVARLLERSGLPFARRSAGTPIPPGAIILGDTMGELSAIWGCATIAFVGGSLDGKRGGQNMIEPSAYGAAVVFGPHTWNFKQTVADLLASDAAIQVQDAAALEAAVLRLLDDAALRDRLGQAARAFVLSQQGATAKTLDALRELMGISEAGKIAA